MAHLYCNRFHAEDVDSKRFEAVRKRIIGEPNQRLRHSAGNLIKI
jgi:hypothetical protein